MSNIQQINHLEIIVRGYNDQPLKNQPDDQYARSQYFGAMVRTYMNHTNVVTDFKIKPKILKDEDGSGFREELQLILNEIIMWYPQVQSNVNISIVYKERSIPNIIKRLKQVMYYVNSHNGRSAFKIDSLRDFVTDMYDQNLFNPNMKNIDIIDDFLLKFVPMIYDNVNSNTITFECISYTPKTDDKDHPIKSKYWDVTDAVKSQVIAYGNRQMGLTETQIAAQVKERRYK